MHNYFVVGKKVIFVTEFAIFGKKFPFYKVDQWIGKWLFLACSLLICILRSDFEVVRKVVLQTRIILVWRKIGIFFLVGDPEKIMGKSTYLVILEN